MPSLVLADTSKTDSLLALVKDAKGQEKTDILNQLCLEYCYSDPGKAKQYAFSAIQNGEKEHYGEGVGKAYIRLGIAYDVSGNYDSAVYCYKQALIKYTSPKGIGSAYNNLGLIAWKHGKLNEAINFLYSALPYLQQLDDKNYLANLYNNIGLIHTDVQNNRRALVFLFKALNLYKTLNDYENIGGTYTNISNSYSYINEHDSAMYYINLSIKYNQQTNNTYGLSISYNCLGTLLSSNNSKKYDEAIHYYLKSLELKKQINDEDGIVSLYNNIADTYKSTHHNDSFLIYSYWALTLSKKAVLLNRQKNIYQSLAHYYASQKNADSLYRYLNLANTVKDSIYNQDLRNALADAETKYETKEKELMIKTQEYQLTKKNDYIIILFILLITTGILFFVIYSRHKLKQQNKFQAELIRQQDIATKAVIQAEENERKRVATDLHDSVGQILSAVKINLSTLTNTISKENSLKYTGIIDMVDDACKEVRSISHNMMPNALLKNGLASAIKEFISQIYSDVLKVGLNTTGLDQRLENNTEIVLYRVVQESVNNVIKHAKATTLEIQISKDEDGISLTIEDDGVGFQTNQQTEGIGLKNLKSRIDFLKGELDIQSSLGKGTLIAIFIPLSK